MGACSNSGSVGRRRQEWKSEKEETKSRRAKEKYVGFSEGPPPAGPDAASVHVCVRHTESSVLLGGLWRAAKIILLKTGHHQDYCVVSSRIRRPAGFLKHLRVASWKTSSTCSVCVRCRLTDHPAQSHKDAHCVAREPGAEHAHWSHFWREPQQLLVSLCTHCEIL